MTTRGIVHLAAAIAALQCVAHTYLIATYKAHHGPAELAVVAAMQQYRFHFGGPWLHTYWDLYSGYAILAAFSCLIEALLLGTVASWIEDSPQQARHIVLLFAAANLGYCAIVLRYFFLTPLLPDLAIAACLLIAFFKLRLHRKTAAGVAGPL